MDTVAQVTLPPRVHQQMRALVAEGWFRDESELVIEALRRYLESHQPELMERFIREDVEWGLHGRD
jgi:Arc/MetJ-type ribon-helix-helix transcriptional regulator